MRDLANANLGIMVGVLNGGIGCREASTAVGASREVRRAVVEGQKIGYEKHVLDHGGCDTEREAILAEERELTERLERLRERRGG